MAKAEPEVDGVAIRQQRRPLSVQTGTPKARRRLVHPELRGKNETLTRMHARWVDPADVLVITDRAHPRYDPRGELEVPQTMVDSLAAYGCIEPVVVCRNGGTLEVVDGRLRVLGLRRVNEDRRRAGRWPLRLPVVLRACADDREALAVAATANGVRYDDTIYGRALKAAALVKAGLTQREVAVAMGLHEAAVCLYMRLTRLVPALQQMAAAGRVTLKDAKVLSKLPRESQLPAFAEIERKRNPPPAGESGFRRTGRRIHDLARYLAEVDGAAMEPEISLLIMWLLGDEGTTDDHLLARWPRLASFFAS